MINIRDISDITDLYAGWDTVESSYGQYRRCPELLGEGTVQIIGDMSRVFIVNTDYKLHHFSLIRNVQKEKMIALAEIKSKGVEFYRSREDVRDEDTGIICRILDYPTPLYSQLPNDVRLISTAVFIRESVLKELGILDDPNVFKSFQRCLNEKNLYSYEITKLIKSFETLSNGNPYKPRPLEEDVIAIVDILSMLVENSKSNTQIDYHLAIVEDVKSYIDNNYISAPSIEELCSMFYTNKNVLQSGFKQITGLSVRDYIVYQRINHSIDLLIKTDLCIEDIVSKVGYKSKSSFYTAFKKIVGITPQEYRIGINGSFFKMQSV